MSDKTKLEELFSVIIKNDEQAADTLDSIITELLGADSESEIEFRVKLKPKDNGKYDVNTKTNTRIRKDIKKNFSKSSVIEVDDQGNITGSTDNDNDEEDEEKTED